MGLCALVTLCAPAAAARGQAFGPIAYDPGIAHQGTALVLGVDGTALSPDGHSPTSITAALPRGTSADTASRAKLCSHKQASRATCAAASRIGFGRYVVGMTGFLAPGGQTQLTWAIDAFLGTRVKSGDIASVVLVAKLLGADSVTELLVPEIGTTVPTTSTSSGRLLRVGSGAYGIELRLPGLPVAVAVPPPSQAIPARLELNLSAVRRVRQDFIRHYKVRTLSGYVIRKIPDHRLVGHNLLRAPEHCGSSWPYQLRVGFADGVQRTSGRLPCTDAPF